MRMWEGRSGCLSLAVSASWRDAVRRWLPQVRDSVAWGSPCVALWASATPPGAGPDSAAAGPGHRVSDWSQAQEGGSLCVLGRGHSGQLLASTGPRLCLALGQMLP